MTAAEVRLGPEAPLSPELELIPVFSQLTSVASDGRDFLLVWADGRLSGPDIFVTRVGSDGRPIAPAGRRIAPGTNPKVAASANGYLIVWKIAAGIRSVRVDADGVPLAAPRMLTGPTTDPIALLSNGTTFLLVYLDPVNNRHTALLLDADGAPLRATNLTTHATFGAGVRGKQYVVVGMADYNPPRSIHTILEDGSVSTVTLTEDAWPAPFDLATAAFAPHAILLVSASGAYTVVGYDGTIIRPRTTLTLVGTRRDLAAAWDGRQFLAVFSGQNAFRVAADGTPLDSTPFSIDSGAASGLKFAANGATLLGVWLQEVLKGGLVGRVVTDFSALAAASTPATPLALTGEAQIDVQIARNANGVFGVWSDSGRYAVYASFNGEPLTVDETDTDDFVGWPAIVAGERSFLVAWRHNVIHGKQQVLARRYDVDGHPLDAAPIVLDSIDSSNPYSGTPPGIGFNGSTYFVAWNRTLNAIANSKVYSARIREEGPPFDVRETTTIAGGFYGSYVRHLRVLSTGAGFLVAYTNDGTASQSYYYPPSALEVIRFDGVSTTSVQTAARILFYLEGTGRPFSATIANDRITYAWADADQHYDIRLAQTTLDGTIVRMPQPAFSRPAEDGLSIAGITWNGSEYVLAWLDAVERDSGARKLRALRFDVDLKQLDPAPFDVFAGPGPLSPPWLIRTPAGVLIAYSRSDDANAKAARVFTRALDRIPGAPHRRAVGR